MPWTRLSAALAIFLAGCAGLRAQEFFPIRNENPLLRGFYLPLPSDARRAGGPILGLTLSVSNTLNVERNSRESLIVDGESVNLRIDYDRQLAPDWRYRLTVPMTRDSGGALDTSIDSWHRLFGLNRGNRPYYPKNEILYAYSGTSSINLARSSSSVGDLSADLGWFARDTAVRTVSIWAGVKAPTGSVAKLTSDGAWDGAVWGHVALRGTYWQWAAELGISQPFGDRLFAGAAHRCAAFGRTAVTRSLGLDWSLRAQLDGLSGRLRGSDLRFLGPSLQLTLGVVRRLGTRWRLDMGFTEDAAVDTAPDVTFFIGIHG